VGRYEPFTQPSYVMISFVLLNDDDKPLDTSEASWRLIIDGREVGDSGIVFWQWLRTDWRLENLKSRSNG
jgi:hypothetical protein